MKIGFLSLPLFGHLNPMTALARKLQSRGNEVVFITVPDAEPVLRAANLNFGTVPGIQVVLSVGHNVNLDDLRPIPSNTLVVQSAPQIELLKRAVLCITHAGLNTTPRH